jgi:biopolymer transport protein ExbB
MKKLIALFSIIGFLTIGIFNVHAEGTPDSTMKDSTAVAAAPADTAAAAAPAAPAEGGQTFHQSIKRYFVEGGPEFMALVVITLIIGLAISIERIIYLNLSSTNTEKLLNKVETALRSGGINAAREVCKSTPGPVAGVFLEGLNRTDEGIDIVEKTIIAYGSVEMGKLEKGLPWISLMIALAPMLGFLGTVVGMIQAFDAIAIAGDISPNVVASGIKVALITTVGGLIVAIILQIFYNYILSKIESLVGSMEEASISFIDVLVKSNTVSK